MLYRSITLVLVLAVILSLTSIASGHISGWKMVHGDVLQVFPEQHKILMKINGEQTILVLDAQCPIYRLGTTVRLESMRPIAPDTFQDALCWIDEQGLVRHVLVNYNVHEEDGVLVAYDIFGNLK